MPIGTWYSITGEWKPKPESTPHFARTQSSLKVWIAFIVLGQFPRDKRLFVAVSLDQSLIHLHTSSGIVSGQRWHYNNLAYPKDCPSKQTNMVLVFYWGGWTVAVAPKNTSRRVPSLHELDEDLKYSVPSAIDGLDMSLLTKTLVPPEMVRLLRLNASLQEFPSQSTPLAVTTSARTWGHPRLELVKENTAEESGYIIYRRRTSYVNESCATESARFHKLNESWMCSRKKRMLDDFLRLTEDK